MSDASPTASRLPLPVMVAAAALGVVVAATATLWAYFGTAMFYEMILTGFAACF